MCLLAIYLYSLGKYLLESFAPLLIELFGGGCLLLLSVRSSLYVLGTDLLPSIWLANVSSHSLDCFAISLLFPLLHSFKRHVVPFVHLCFCCLCFWCHIYEIITKFSVMKLLSCDIKTCSTKFTI
jgi:hypothetical protein